MGMLEAAELCLTSRAPTETALSQKCSARFHFSGCILFYFFLGGWLWSGLGCEIGDILSSCRFLGVTLLEVKLLP